MITVAIIEDHQILVDALGLMLSRDEGFQFVGSAATLAGGLDLIQRTHPSVLLLDLHLPDGNGYQIVPKVIETSPHTRVVVLTSYTDEETIMQAIDLGVSGFLPKNTPLNEFFSTLRKAAEGDVIMPSKLLIGLLKRMPREQMISRRQDSISKKLTPREYEILTYLAAGKSGNAIAEALDIAPLTVRTHVRNLMSKLGVHSRLEAVAFGVRHGLVAQ